MTSVLKKFISQYGQLCERDMEELVNKFDVQKAIKGQILLEQGQICKNLFIVTKLSLRLFYIANVIEITDWFSIENTSAIELSSFLSETPSDYFLQAIEDSEILTLPKTRLLRLYETHTAMQEIMRTFWEDVILNLLKRFTALQKDSAEKRYLHLLSRPVYLQRIPQKYLASYIGVTPTSLSRIRKNIK
jgi:CRP-like cAMP-binding protein